MVGEAPIPTLVSNAPMMMAPPKESLLPPLATSKVLMGAGIKKKMLKAVKLSEVTKPLSDSEKAKQVLSALRRILESGDHMSEVKCNLVSSIVITSSFELRFCKFT